MTLTLCLLLALSSVEGLALSSVEGLSQATPVQVDDLDTLVEWVDGAARPSKAGPRQVLWTRTSAPDWNGLRFGDSKTDRKSVV